MNSAQWWDRFYGTHGHQPHEWYSDGVVSCLQLLQQSSAATLRILHVGCGCSTLGDDLAAAGHAVRNVDFSPVVIEQQVARVASLRTRQVYAVADACCLPASYSWPPGPELGPGPEGKAEEEQGPAHVAVDKGTLDALMADRTPDNLAAGTAAIRSMLSATLMPSPSSHGYTRGYHWLLLGSMIDPSLRVGDVTAALPAPVQVQYSSTWPPRISDAHTHPASALATTATLTVHTVPEAPLEKPSQQAWWWYEIKVPVGQEEARGT